MKIVNKSRKNTSCECLEIAERFTEYQKKCLTEKPHDENIHTWLKATSINIEHLVSSTIITLARLEGLIDEKNEFTGSDELID